MHLISPNVFTEKGRLYTRSPFKKSTTGARVIERAEYYHEWDPYRSKIAAALTRKLERLLIAEDSRVLYLGCGSGTTVSHISDIVRDGIVFAVDISEKEMRLLYVLLKDRMNVAPVLADARDPHSIGTCVGTDVDVIIQDIASRDQVDIFARSARHLLRSGGEVYLSLKTKSISSTSPPTRTLDEVKERLRREFTLLRSVNLRGYQDHHWLLHLRKP